MKLVPNILIFNHNHPLSVSSIPASLASKLDLILMTYHGQDEDKFFIVKNRFTSHVNHVDRQTIEHVLAVAKQMNGMEYV